MSTRVIVLVVLILLSVIIMLQNTQDAVFKVLFWSIFIPRILLIFIMLLLGFAIGYVVARIRANKPAGAE